MERVTACHGVLSRRRFTGDGRARARRRESVAYHFCQAFCHPFHGFRYCFYGIEGFGASRLAVARLLRPHRTRPCWRMLRSTPSLWICHPLKRVQNSARLWLADWRFVQLKSPCNGRHINSECVERPSGPRNHSYQYKKGMGTRETGGSLSRRRV